jgi:hypothetical protein
MTAGCANPALADVLGDPVVQLMMRADGVDPQVLSVELRAVAARLGLVARDVPFWRSARCSARAAARTRCPA